MHFSHNIYIWPTNWQEIHELMKQSVADQQYCVVTSKLRHALHIVFLCHEVETDQSRNVCCQSCSHKQVRANIHHGVGTLHNCPTIIASGMTTPFIHHFNILTGLKIRSEKFIKLSCLYAALQLLVLANQGQLSAIYCFGLFQ